MTPPPAPGATAATTPSERAPPLRVASALSVWRAALALGALAALHAALAWDAAAGDAVTYDETAHIAAGYAHLVHRDFRLNPEHPPLAKAIAAAGVLAWAPPPPLPETLPLWQQAHRYPDARWLYGHAFLFGRPADVDARAVVAAARLPMILLALGLLAVLAYVAWRLGGAGAAVASVALAAVDPSLLGHGHLVTTDVPVTLALWAASIAAAALAWRPSWSRWACLGVAGGLALLTKFTAVVWLGVLVATLLPLLAWRQRRWARLPRLLAGSALAAAVAWATLWAGYGFSFAPSSLPGARLPVAAIVEQAADPALGHGAAARAIGRAIDVLHSARALPEAWLFGLGYAALKAQARRTYLLGTVADHADARFFPLGLASKQTLAMLALELGAALWVLGWAWRWWRQRKGTVATNDPGDGALASTPQPAVAVRLRDPNGEPALDGIDRLRADRWTLALCLALPALALLAVAMAGRLAIGLRHILPFVAILWLWAGLTVARLAQQRRGLALAAALWAAHAGSSLANHPHHLAYFHEGFGGRDGGAALFVDSNLDWGQDLGRLADWLRAHDVAWVNLAYFGTDDPARHGIVGPRLEAGGPYPLRYQPLRRPGLLAISESVRVGLELDVAGRARVASWLHHARHVATIGGSIRVYAVP